MDDPTSAPTNVSTPQASQGGLWQFDPAQAEAPLGAAVCSPLADLGVIAVSGDEAARFLHGQLTNDVEHLAPDRLGLNGYCTAKGRLLATVRIWRDPGAIQLLLPREILPTVLRRLSMFVLRAKAKLVDASDDWKAWAVFGAGSPGCRARRACPTVSSSSHRWPTRRTFRPGLPVCARWRAGPSGGARSTPACRRSSLRPRKSSCRR
jgi:hypothetical protein